MKRNLPGPAGRLKGEGVSQAAKASYVCAKCQQTFRWYKGVKTLGNGIGLCEVHNPNYKRDEVRLADGPPEDVPPPDPAIPCNTTK